MTLDQAIEQIQFCYPQIYYACHTRHQRSRSSPTGLSHRDIELLVHLSRTTPMTMTALARHMDLALSTVSEAVKALDAHGYVARCHPRADDRRHTGLTLTPKGVNAVRSGSVLEAARLRVVLGRLRPKEIEVVAAGLSLLSQACRRPS